MTYRFTVFTPTYNRAHTLARVYESLKKQTFRDFEWLIVDDGSIDRTHELVSQWQNENPFPIRYFRQEKAHKKSAFNRGVLESGGELFLTWDSDDEALPVALETFNRFWLDIPAVGRERFSAVTALCADPKGNIIGDRFPKDVFDSNSLEIIFRYRIKGDKWGFQKTSILRHIPFPENIRGLVPEATVWNRIAHSYKTRYINVPLKIVRYESDGLTNNLPAIEQRADGRTYFAREVLENDWRWIRYNPNAILKEAAAYTYFGRYLSVSQNGKSWPLHGAVPRLLVFLMRPLGILRYWLDSIRLSRA